MRLQVIRVGETPRLSRALPTGELTRRRIHSHFTYEVFFITEGHLTLVTEAGQQTYGRKVIIIPPRIGHYTLANQNGSFCLLFSFETRREGEKILQEIRKRLDQGIYQLPLSEDISYYIRAIARKTEESTPGAEREVELLTTLIFCELLGQFLPEEQRQEPRRNESKHIAAIETYINANYHQRVTLSDVASHVFLSTRQVTRILQREYGCSLSHLLMEKRLAQAQMLLKNTSFSVAQVASRVGLASENYFFVVFKKRYGITPLQYRKEQNLAQDAPTP